MNKLINPETQFDALTIGIKLYDYFDGFKREELQLFAYFSSIFFFYTRNPRIDDEWGYDFIVDENGFPFSQNLNLAYEQHLLNRNFETKDRFSIITQEGVKLFDKTKNHSLFKNREKAIDTACTASILVSYEKTERALLNDDEIIKAKSIGNQPILDRKNIYNKIREISKKVGAPIDDLIIPAVSWLNYLIEKENEE
jgi:hypothetical protein